MILPLRRWAPDVHGRLVRMLEQTDPSTRPVATFDWDDTCIRGDLSDAMLGRLDAADGRDRLGAYFTRAAHDPVGAWVDCAAALAGMTDDEAAAFATESLDLAIAAGRISLRPEIGDLVEALQAAGWDVWIATGTLEQAVAACAPRYGIPGDRVIGQRMRPDAHGRIGTEAGGPVMFRAGKVQAITERIGRMPTFAAGDADSDTDMLETARHRLVMTGRGPVIRARAAEGGWWVQPGF